MAEDSSAELAAVCRRQFEKCYGYRAEKAFFAPGRINILGEHIDYNGGLVFPCAIGLGTAGGGGQAPFFANKPRQRAEKAAFVGLSFLCGLAA